MITLEFARVFLYGVFLLSMLEGSVPVEGHCVRYKLN